MTEHRHDAQLQRDVRRLAVHGTPRRRFLQLLACVAAVPLVGCGKETLADGEDDDTSGGGGGETESREDGECAQIPEETAGPYPGDGSNGANALALSGIVRSDITTSLGGASGVAEGVPLTVELTLVNPSDGCTPLEGYAVYLWHCDREGNYSMYSARVKSESYLRGVQETDQAGKVTFTTVFPGCYAGRMPHMHFEVYPGLAAATDASNKIVTSQLAFPVATCEVVYEEEGYETSVRNFAQISFARDNVFSDGTELQLAAMTGSNEEGYVAKLVVGVSD